MGLYTMYRYVPSAKMFDVSSQRDETNLKVFDDKMGNYIYNKFQQDSDRYIKQIQASKLQYTLNDVYYNHKEDYNKLIMNIFDIIKNKGVEELQNRLGEGGIQIQGGTVVLNKEVKNFEILARNYLKEFNKKYKDSDEYSTVIQRLEGTLNSARGKLFETFLATIFNSLSDNLEDILEYEQTDMINMFQEALIKANKDNSNIKLSLAKKVDKNRRSKVTGDSTKKTINVQIKDINDNITNLSIKGGQIKSDLYATGLNGGSLMKTGISAKNYNDLNRKVSLLSSANIVGLISNQPASMTMKSLALNGLSSKSIYNQQFEIIKKLFFIQGLLGTATENIKAELFIINTNQDPHPFLVLSGYDLLFTQGLEGDFSGSKITPIQYRKNDGRTINKFIKFLNETKISIETTLTIENLKKYTYVRTFE